MEHTVLIIDDEPNFCTSLQVLLRADGYTTVTAHSGQEALFHLEQNRFDGILLDLGLPDMGGIEIAGLVRAKYPETVVIVLTGYASLDNAVEALRGGVYDYLRKPFDPEQLLRTLKRGIEHKRLEQRLHRSEERFRQLAQATWEGLIIYDKGVMLLANEQLCEMFGYQEDELVGRQIFDILLDRTTIRPMRPEEGQPNDVGPFEAEGIRRDGSRFPVELRIKHITFSGRQAQVAAVRDVTACRQAMDNQIALQQKLADARRMEALGLMAGSVAHDLNNIIAGLITYPELLLMDLPRDFRYREEIEMIRDAGKRAAAVVADLLTVARGSTSKKEIINFNTLVSGYLNSVECRELKRRFPCLRISSSMDEKLFNTSCSGVHITKTIMNLVNNAAEATGDNGEISIRTQNCYVEAPIQGYEIIEPGEYVTIEVCDNGPGIPPRDLPHIFEPFYSKKVMGRSGTGLGLAVVWNTVHDHGGYIDLKTGQHGTTFVLYFPVTHQNPEQRPAPLSPGDLGGRGEKILVVDDQKSQREIARRLLSRLGYQVDAVESGEKAVEYIRQKNVDLVMLDMVMEPGIDGCETYQRIIRIKPGLKAILTSGYSGGEQVAQARRLGISHFIRKPYSLQELSRAIRLEIS